VGREYRDIVGRIEAAARVKHVGNGAPRQELWPFAEREQAGRIGEPARNAVELQLSGKLVLLNLQIVTGEVEIQSVVVCPNMAVQPTVGTDEFENVGAELLG